MIKEIITGTKGRKVYISCKGALGHPIFVQSHGESAERRETTIGGTDVAKTMFPMRNQFLMGKANESMMVDAVSVSQTID